MMNKTIFATVALLLVLAFMLPAMIVTRVAAQDGGTITAHKFNDLNGNGIQDAGEEDLGGWGMELYVGSSCVGNDILASGMTNSSGNVIFSNLQSGDYSVQEQTLLGWQNTTPICQDVTLPPGGSEIVSFGNQQAGVGGEAHPINKVGLTAPWIALAVVITAGSFYLVRRKVLGSK
jgi:hypothetical protein